jgi:hypothetical protein
MYTSTDQTNDDDDIWWWMCKGVNGSPTPRPVVVEEE